MDETRIAYLVVLVVGLLFVGRWAVHIYRLRRRYEVWGDRLSTRSRSPAG